MPHSYLPFINLKCDYYSIVPPPLESSLESHPNIPTKTKPTTHITHAPYVPAERKNAASMINTYPRSTGFSVECGILSFSLDGNTVRQEKRQTWPDKRQETRLIQVSK